MTADEGGMFCYKFDTLYHVQYNAPLIPPLYNVTSCLYASFVWWARPTVAW